MQVDMAPFKEEFVGYSRTFQGVENQDIQPIMIHFHDLQVVSIVHVYATENTLSNVAYKNFVSCGAQRSNVRLGMSFL